MLNTITAALLLALASASPSAASPGQGWGQRCTPRGETKAHGLAVIRLYTLPNGEPAVEDMCWGGERRSLLGQADIMRLYDEHKGATTSLFSVAPNVQFSPHAPPAGKIEMFFMLDGSATIDFPNGRSRVVGPHTIVVNESTGTRATAARAGPRGYLALNIAIARDEQR